MSIEKRTDGDYRLDSYFGHLGRVRRSLGTASKSEARQRESLIAKLWKTGRYDLVEAFQHGRVTIEQLVAADRSERLGSTLADLALSQNLWDTIDATLPRMGDAEETRKRYKTSFGSLRHKARKILGPNAIVSDLARVDWRTLRDNWNASGTDWMHLRRAVSRFLTLVLGHESHPFRVQVMTNFVTARENKRKPDLPQNVIADIIDNHAREDVRDFFWCAVITGFRLGELCAIREEHLNAETFSIYVPGTKTESSAEVVRVDPELWGYIRRGLPAKHAKRWYQELWLDAVRAAGRDDIHFHDLRHCHGQWAIDEGVAESKVQSSLRHSSAAMTRRYVVRNDTSEVSAAIAKVLRKAPVLMAGVGI